jgi:hypothetical protein
MRQAMITAGRRRAAVTTADGQLLGPLCLKASQAGFCSDQDVRARALGNALPFAHVNVGVGDGAVTVQGPCAGQLLAVL